MSSISTPDTQQTSASRNKQIQHAYQQQQPMDLFQQSSLKQQQIQQSYKQQPIDTLESQQQPQQSVYNNQPATMLYSQSSVPPLSQYQFSYSPNMPSQINTMYSTQRQQKIPMRNTTTSSIQSQSRNYNLTSTSSNMSSSTNGNRQLRAASISSSIPQAEYPESVVRPKVATTRWDDENTNCYQVRARNILVSRREDTNYINGTKLLNVIGMTRGKRDGILKTEKVKNVVKVGSMNLKGIWIPFDRAFEIARNEGVDGLLYPLFVKDIKEHFLTKGHKLKSEDDLNGNEDQSVNEKDDLLSEDLIGNVGGENSGGSGNTNSNSTTETNNSPMITQSKYQQQQGLQQAQSFTPQTKDEDIYNQSSQNTPLNVPKTF
ncbi:unnamed protein product [Candida verbasci]|uniref:HTH APSES-type domain-containing protein n=1 Tax=Candida verbasci TaxID=1227364 RepID=A0A9W4TVL6_9ASCO|nr:unnamed protein product [Candida verbasci]